MKGFTLVEILVAITIMGILGIIGFINYQSFQSSQLLNEGVSLVQSTLRAAQSNATAAVKCQNLGGATWTATFDGNKNFNLKCKTATSAISTQRSYGLPANVQMLNISGDSCDALYPMSVNFSPLFGLVSFESSTSCVASQNSITFRLTNTKTGESKIVTITKGGAIEVGSAATTPVSTPTPTPAPTPTPTPTPTCTPATWYRDADGDGYGTSTTTTSACTQPAGYVSNSSDCYDGNINARPGQTSYFSTNRGDWNWDYNCNNGVEYNPPYQRHSAIPDQCIAIFQDAYCGYSSATACGSSDWCFFNVSSCTGTQFTTVNCR